MKRAKNKLQDDEALAAFIMERVRRGINTEEGEVSQVRKEVFNSYFGKNYGNEQPGYSQYVTREVLTTIEWLHPAICSVFLSGKVVQLKPYNQRDEQSAEFETRVLNDLVMRDPDTWAAFEDFIKDVLLYPNGYCKVHMDDSTITPREKRRYNGVTQEELDAILSERGEYSTISIEGEPEARMVMGPGDIPTLVFDVDIVRTRDKASVPTIECLPQEEVIIDSDHRMLDLDRCPFIDHYTRKTYSELRLMGFSEDELHDVNEAANERKFGDETSNRLFYIDEDPDFEESLHPDPSMRFYNFHECWIRMDWDDDGIAELRHVIMVNSTVLRNEEADCQPIVAMSAIPIAHKHVGMGIAETIIELQKLSTQLTRQMLDNIYKINRGRTFINRDAFTHDGSTLQYLQDAESEYVPLAGPAGPNIYQEQPNAIIDKIQPVLDRIRSEQQMRSGVNPGIMIDPDILQKSTATGMQQQLEQMSERVRHLAKVFAERAFKRIFLKIHHLMRTQVDRQLELKVYDQWVQYNPAYWEDRDRVQVNVGLGLGNTSEIMQFCMQLLGIQKDLTGMGLATPQNVYQTAKLLVESMDIGDATDFFVDPRSPQYQPPQPAPDAQLELAKAEQAKVQAMAARDQAKNQLEIEQLKMQARKDEVELQLTQARAQLDRMKLELEARQSENTTRLAEVESAQRYEAELAKLIAQVNETTAKTRLLGAQTAKILVEIGETGEDETGQEETAKLEA